MNAQEVRDLLHKEVCEVEFTKKDGSKRVMYCTLMPEYLPEYDSASTSTPPSEDIITVWDLEADGWRSFRMDRLIGIEADG